MRTITKCEINGIHMEREDGVNAFYDIFDGIVSLSVAFDKTGCIELSGDELGYFYKRIPQLQKAHAHKYCIHHCRMLTNGSCDICKREESK